MVRTESDFALHLGLLIGVMSNLEEQGITTHSSVPKAEWEELKTVATKVAGRFYEEKKEEE